MWKPSLLLRSHRHRSETRGRRGLSHASSTRIGALLTFISDDMSTVMLDLAVAATLEDKGATILSAALRGGSRKDQIQSSGTEAVW